MVNLSSPREKGNTKSLTVRWPHVEQQELPRSDDIQLHPKNTLFHNAHDNCDLREHGTIIRSTLLLFIAILWWIYGTYLILIWQRFPFQKHKGTASLLLFGLPLLTILIFVNWSSIRNNITSGNKKNSKHA